MTTAEKASICTHYLHRTRKEPADWFIDIELYPYGVIKIVEDYHQ